MALELELLRERERCVAQAAALYSEGQYAAGRSRLLRQVRRAERKTRTYADQAERLRARMARIEAGR